MSNTYQALYRKWRPQTFSDVCGQDTVTKALKNELKTGRLSHAYLFTGCRGTGKTTCAKILAKAVNCLHPVDGDPCNECALCRGIDDGSVLDVTEIDAASNNGVDNIRDLREEVSFTPVNGTYRVYIIDEVHMLSAGAFNALLKTLEEPPAHVIFVLATTEVHKLPATILSRCQRFDFGRIAAESIAARLRHVAQEEGLTLTDGAAMLLARLADGALRDALSLLDQCAATGDAIDETHVTAVTGLAGQEILSALTNCIYTRDAAGALAQLDTLYQSAKDMERLCHEWVSYMRNLMVLCSMADPGELIVAAPDAIEQMRAQAAQLQLPLILHILETLQDTLGRLGGGVSRRVEMEMAVLRLCDPRLDDSTAALLDRIAALESALKSGTPVSAPAAPAAAAPVPAPAAAPAEVPAIPDPPVPAPAAAPAEVPAIPDPPAPAAPADTDSGEERPFPQWGEVLAALQQSCPPLHSVLMDSSALLKDGKLIICTDNAMFKELFMMGNNKDLLMEAIRTVSGTTYRVGLRRTQKVEKAQRDPLSQLLAAGKAVGVTVQENE